MPKPVLLNLGAALALSLVAVAARAKDDNQCVACHAVEVLPISLGHSFDDWRSSAHGRGGVGCERCHGGDASASDAKTAHRGVLPAAETGSLVHPTRIPATCGVCHTKELAAFDGTAHARQLKKQGAGATCSTCHGAMATSLPSPGELSSRCAVCHEKPLEARAALAVLASAKLGLQRTYRSLQAVQAKHPEWYGQAVERFHGLERSFREIELEWHTFETRKVLQQSKDVLKLAEALSEEAGIVARRPAE
jgi:hypothetical protein